MFYSVWLPVRFYLYFIKIKLILHNKSRSETGAFAEENGTVLYTNFKTESNDQISAIKITTLIAAQRET